jgi:hypothetical protein
MEFFKAVLEDKVECQRDENLRVQNRACNDKTIQLKSVS